MISRDIYVFLEIAAGKIHEKIPIFVNSEFITRL